MASDDGRRSRTRQGRRPAAGSRQVESAAADDDIDREKIDYASVARAVVLRQLTSAAKTRAQLAEKIAAKDVPDEVAEQVLDRFEAVGLINDREFAEMFVRSRQESRGLASRALAMEMRRKGVPDDIAQDVLGTIDSDDESEMAFRLARKKVATSGNATDDQIYRRTMSFLARKGYGPDLCSRAVRAAMAGRVVAEDDAGDSPNDYEFDFNEDR